MFFWCLLLVNASLVFSIDPDSRSLLQKGMSEFKNTNYSESALIFEKIINNENMSKLHSDAYFWAAKSYIAVGQYSNAEKYIEHFLINYPDHFRYPECLYQKGRLFYLQSDYENTIKFFNSFIEEHPNSPFIAGAYFWVGESLFLLGHLDEAKTTYSVIVNKYQASQKVESARYRISLIELANRELELIQLLKKSHEESEKAFKEYRTREKSYENAIEFYQNMIGSDNKISIEKLRNENEKLRKEIEELNKKLGNKSSYETSIDSSSEVTNEDLLKLKKDAEDIKTFYQDKINNSSR